MLRTTMLAAGLLGGALMAAAPAAGHGLDLDDSGLAPVRADGHAPIGVMGDHRHGAKEWMVSYRFMNMKMDGNRIGTRSVSPEEIATSVPNRFADRPMQPPTLRIVPTEMTMRMHMFGLMYAPSDWLTMMVMGMYQTREMDHITFQGGSGTDRLGTFTTRSSGFGDTKVVGLVGLWEDEINDVHLNLGLSLPSGRITHSDSILTPTGARPTVRLPYAMQIGSGTVDLEPGITYNGGLGNVTWGAQYRAVGRIGRNSEGYSLGNEHHLTAWTQYQWAPWVSTSFRMAGESVGTIDGIDPNIVGPVQTADPDNYGGERLEALFGFNLTGQSGVLRGHRVALEFGVPLIQDLNGPQMERDFQVMVGYQKAF